MSLRHLAIVAALLAATARAQETEDWKTLHDRGVAQLESWKLVEACAALSEAVTKAREFEQPDERLALSLTRLATAQEVMRQPAAARKNLDEAVTVLEGVHGKSSVELHPPLEILARLRRSANDFAGAVEIQRRMLTIADAAKKESDPEPLEIIVPLARDLRALGRFAESIPLFERGKAEMEVRLGDPMHVDMTRPIADLAHVYRMVKRLDDAAELYRRWIAIVEKAKGKDHPNIGAGLESLATVQMEGGKPAAAEATYRRWQKIIISISSTENANVAALQGRIANALFAQQKNEEAAEAYEQCLAMYEKHLGGEKPVMAPLLLKLSGIQRELKRHDEAVASARRALKILEDPRRSQPLKVEDGMMVLARALAGQGSWKEANTVARDVVARREKRIGPTHASLLEPLTIMAWVLREMEQEESAVKAEARIEAIRKARKAPKAGD